MWRLVDTTGRSCRSRPRSRPPSPTPAGGQAARPAARARHQPVSKPMLSTPVGATARPERVPAGLISRVSAPQTEEEVDLLVFDDGLLLVPVPAPTAAHRAERRRQQVDEEEGRERPARRRLRRDASASGAAGPARAGWISPTSSAPGIAEQPDVDAHPRAQRRRGPHRPGGHARHRPAGPGGRGAEPDARHPAARLTRRRLRCRAGCSGRSGSSRRRAVRRPAPPPGPGAPAPGRRACGSISASSSRPRWTCLCSTRTSYFVATTWLTEVKSRRLPPARP